MSREVQICEAYHHVYYLASPVKKGAVAVVEFLPVAERKVMEV